ncbi:YciI family protein [Arthrobacter sp. NA-172]|uniref:YciI family protein n=1 Tax=Arthrobacter sp. NA-172 TaxID=3367524 RepID=UPI003754AFD3
MKHLLLIQNNMDTWNALPASEIEAIMEAHNSLQQELRASGEFVEAHELGEESKFVRNNGAGFTVTDGPFIETKEIAAGYYIVDCVDMARAVEIAGKLGEAKLWPIEVRAIDPRREDVLRA